MSVMLKVRLLPPERLFLADMGTVPDFSLNEDPDTAPRARKIASRVCLQAAWFDSKIRHCFMPDSGARKPHLNHRPCSSCPQGHRPAGVYKQSRFDSWVRRLFFLLYA
jgi:hypothetical protein